MAETRKIVLPEIKTQDELRNHVHSIAVSLEKMFRGPRTQNSLSTATKLDVMILHLEAARDWGRHLEGLED